MGKGYLLEASVYAGFNRRWLEWRNRYGAEAVSELYIKIMQLRLNNTPGVHSGVHNNNYYAISR